MRAFRMLIAASTLASKMPPVLMQRKRDRLMRLAPARATDRTARSQRHTVLHEARIARQILGPAAEIARRHQKHRILDPHAVLERHREGRFARTGQECRDLRGAALSGEA